MAEFTDHGQLVLNLSLLLAEFVDDEQCDFDHHGYCQTHLDFSGNGCRNAKARELLNDGRLARHIPRRGDEVEEWLERLREDEDPGTPYYVALDQALADYIAHADGRGVPLSEEVPRG